MRTRASPPHLHLEGGDDEDEGARGALALDEGEDQEVGAGERPTSLRGTTVHDRATTRTLSPFHRISCSLTGSVCLLLY